LRSSPHIPSAGGIASCNNVSVSGNINASRISAVIGGPVFHANHLVISSPSTISAQQMPF
jgi:hypothetical protein